MPSRFIIYSVLTSLSCMLFAISVYLINMEHVGVRIDGRHAWDGRCVECVRVQRTAKPRGDRVPDATIKGLSGVLVFLIATGLCHLRSSQLFTHKSDRNV